MTYQCRLIDPPPFKQPPQPGDMWFMPAYLEDEDGFYKRHFYSPEYMRDWMATRAPIMVCLPDGDHWCVDQKAHESENGWTVTGTAPQITANPSIVSTNYHGWLNNGVLSDDLEGRTYQENSNAR